MVNELSPFSQVEALMQTALEKDDISIVTAQISRMMKARELVGKVLAKTIYLFHQNWYNFSASSSDNFNDVMNSMNLSPDHVKRYLRVWQYYDSLPQAIQDKPIREIIPITNALSQGHEISDEQWEKLERSPNLPETQRIVTEEIKNQERRKSSLQIYLDSDTGTYYAWKNGERHDGGFLDVHSKDLVVQEMIERTVKNTGVTWK